MVHVDQIIGTFKTVCDMQIEVERGPGRPKMAWMTLTDRDPHEWKDNEFDLSQKESVQLASYLEGSLLMWMMLLHLHVTSEFR